MSTSPGVRGGLSRVAARVVGSRFAKPIARVAVVVTSIVVLALVGRAASPHTIATPGAVSTASSAAMEGPTPSAALGATVPAPSVSLPVQALPANRGPASPEDPVVLNTASTEEFRRLPGIGDKRAGALFALRARLGRFRAIEDLLKVKGIGRATLKRLRPLIRLDAKAPSVDAGAAPAPTPRE